MRSSLLSALLPLACLLSSAVAVPAAAKTTSSAAKTTSSATSSSSSAAASSAAGSSAAASGSGIPPAAQQTQPSTLSVSGVKFHFDSYDDDDYGKSTVEFDVADQRSTVATGHCSGSLNQSAYGNVQCVPSSFIFTCFTSFPDFWTLQVNHTVTVSGKTEIRNSTNWFVGIADPDGFFVTYDYAENATSTYSYNGTLTSNYGGLQAPSGWTGDASW